MQIKRGVTSRKEAVKNLARTQSIPIEIGPETPLTFSKQIRVHRLVGLSIKYDLHTKYSVLNEILMPTVEKQASRWVQIARKIPILKKFFPVETTKGGTSVVCVEDFWSDIVRVPLVQIPTHAAWPYQVRGGGLKRKHDMRVVVAFPTRPRLSHNVKFNLVIHESL